MKYPITTSTIAIGATILSIGSYLSFVEPTEFKEAESARNGLAQIAAGEVVNHQYKSELEEQARLNEYAFEVEFQEFKKRDSRYLAVGAIGFGACIIGMMVSPYEQGD